MRVDWRSTGCSKRKAQPLQIFEDRRFVFRLAARGVDVLDAHEKALARLRRR